MFDLWTESRSPALAHGVGEPRQGHRGALRAAVKVHKAAAGVLDTSPGVSAESRTSIVTGTNRLPMQAAIRHRDVEVADGVLDTSPGVSAGLRLRPTHAVRRLKSGGRQDWLPQVGKMDRPQTLREPYDV